MRELYTWITLGLITLAFSAFLIATHYGELRYECSFDDQVMGSNGVCYEVDSFLDSAND